MLCQPSAKQTWSSEEFGFHVSMLRQGAGLKRNLPLACFFDDAARKVVAATRVGYFKNITSTRPSEW